VSESHADPEYSPGAGSDAKRKLDPQMILAEDLLPYDTDYIRSKIGVAQ